MLKYLLAILLIEALTGIVSKSEFFKPVRRFFFNKNRFFSWIHGLLDCPYCTSVWTAWFVLVVFILLDSFYVNLFCYGVMLHRASNILHDLIDKINGID